VFNFSSILFYNYLSAGIGFVSTLLVIRFLDGNLYAIFVSLQYLSLLTYGIGQWGSNMLAPNWTKLEFFSNGYYLTRVNMWLSWPIMIIAFIVMYAMIDAELIEYLYVPIIVLFFIISPLANQQKYIEATYDLSEFYKVKFYYNLFWAVTRVLIAWWSDLILLLLFVNFLISAFPIIYISFVKRDMTGAVKKKYMLSQQLKKNTSMKFLLSGMIGLILFRIELIYFNMNHQLSDKFVATYLSYLPLVDLLYLTSTALAGYFWKKQYKDFCIPVISVVAMLLSASCILVIFVPLYAFITDVAAPEPLILIVMSATVIANFIGSMQTPYISKFNLQRLQFFRATSGVLFFFTITWLTSASGITVLACGLLAALLANIIFPLLMGYPNLLKFKRW
jgi:hypothetical protein